MHICLTRKSITLNFMLHPRIRSQKGNTVKTQARVGAELRLGNEPLDAGSRSFPLLYPALVKSRCDYNLKQRPQELSLFPVDCLLFFRPTIIHVHLNDCNIWETRGKEQKKEVSYKGRVENRQALSETVTCLVGWRPLGGALLTGALGQPQLACATPVTVCLVFTLLSSASEWLCFSQKQ